MLLHGLWVERKHHAPSQPAVLSFLGRTRSLRLSDDGYSPKKGAVLRLPAELGRSQRPGSGVKGFV